MSGHSSNQGATSLQVNCNLHVIRRLCPACLNTDGLPDAHKVRLIQVRIDSQNALHQKTILESDNLLDNTHGSPSIPQMGAIDKATLEIEFKNSSAAQKVTLEHPNTVTLHLPGDASTFLTWLDHIGLTASRQAATSLTTLFLILAAAVAPALGDGDGDDDDPESDRSSFSI